MAWTIDGLIDKSINSALPANCRDIHLSADGLHLYTIHWTGSSTPCIIYSFPLSIAGDLTSIGPSDGNFTPPTENNPSAVALSADETQLYFSGSQMRWIYQFSLPTAGDINNATYTAALAPPAALDAATAIRFSDDGSRLYFVGVFYQPVYQYSLSTPWYLSTGSDDNVTLDISPLTRATGMTFINGGTTLLICSSYEDVVAEYSLSTAGDLATGSNTGLTYDTTGSAGDYIAGLDADQTTGKLFAVGESPSAVHELQLYDPDAPVVVPAAVVYGQWFYLTLTGGADATTDIMLPCSSINARLRSGAPSYLQVVIPYTADYASAVAARPNGDLRLEFDDTGETTTVATVSLETIQESRGIPSGSIVLTGHRQSTNSSPNSHTINVQSLQIGTHSPVAIMPGYNPTIKPADDITAASSTYTVDTVMLQASAQRGGISMQTSYIGS